jgi:LysR family cyn operon transcriptional activator
MEDRLHKFARLVDAGSFTKAAELLHISQPALTTAIQKLERELKTELVVRGSRGGSVRVTSAGQAAYLAAKELAIQNANLKQQIAELSGTQMAARVGAIDSVADALIDDVQTFAALRAQTHLSLSVHNSGQLLRSLEHDDLDIAFVARSEPHSSPLLQTTALGDEPLRLVAHPELAAVIKTALNRGMLPSFLSYNQQAATTQLIHTALAEQGIEPLTTFYSTSPAILLNLTLGKQGAAVLPQRMVAPYLQAGVLEAMELPVINRPIVMAARRGKRLPAPLTDLTERIRAILDELQTQAKQH